MSFGCSYLVIVTLASQVEPALVDLRKATKGRWELTTVAQDEPEEDGKDEANGDEESAPKAK